MKTQKYFLTIFVSAVIIQSVPATAEVRKINIDEVSKHVSQANYNVLTEATKLYQARKSIASARGDLLPSLNVWKIAEAVAEGATVVGIIGALRDLAPFLVPANWFRAKESELLYKAEKEAYRALWGNEILTAKSLYMKAAFDSAFGELLIEQTTEFKSLEEIARARVLMGTVPAELLRSFEIWVLDLNEDRREMSLLLNDERNQITYAMGIPKEEEVIFEPLKLPVMSEVKPIVYDDFIFRVIDTSAEVRQNEHLLKVIPYIKKEINWSFLGVSEISRGTSGGVFDNIPISQGLGFGTGPKIQIVKGKEEILKTQGVGIMETLKRQLDVLVKGHNSNLASYKNAKFRMDLTLKKKQDLEDRLALGDPHVSLPELADAIKDLTLSSFRLLRTRVAHLMFVDRLERLIWAGDYSKKPIVIERLDELGRGSLPGDAQ